MFFSSKKYNNKQKNFEKTKFLLMSCRSRTKIAGSRSGFIVRGADPDPYQKVTDPQHCFFLYLFLRDRYLSFYLYI
jgi:hypothetical protein